MDAARYHRRRAEIANDRHCLPCTRRERPHCAAPPIRLTIALHGDHPTLDAALCRPNAAAFRDWKSGSRRSRNAPSAKSVLSLAFNSRCDVIVATVLAGDKPLAQEQAVLEFLNGDLVRNLAETVLGL